MNISKNIKKKFFSKETIISLLVIFSVAKIFIINHQLSNQSIFVNDYLNFILVWNTGIGFGFFSQNANLYYHLISLVIFTVIIFLIYLVTKASFFEKIFFSLILGGAIGNFYDRIIYFAVPDFVDFHINNFHWFTFNIADIFITLGVIAILVKDLMQKKK